jgi:hypothetical protein
MKVYVIKNKDNKYLTKMQDFAEEIMYAKLFNDVEWAWDYAPNDCRVVECFLIERDEKKEHDKQLVNAVCEWIQAEFEDKAKYSTYFDDDSQFEINLTEELFLEILEKAKGEFR